jgi:hypothetical protein
MGEARGAAHAHPLRPSRRGWPRGRPLGICSGAAQLTGSSPAPTGPALLRVAAGAAGFAVLPVYLRWLLSARFGTLRLALIRTSRLS